MDVEPKLVPLPFEVVDHVRQVVVARRPVPVVHVARARQHVNNSRTTSGGGGGGDDDDSNADKGEVRRTNSQMNNGYHGYGVCTPQKQHIAGGQNNDPFAADGRRRTLTTAHNDGET